MTGPSDDKSNQNDVNKNSQSPQKNQPTAAQLRQARRTARNLGLNPKNGFQAITMLSERGVEIDGLSNAPNSTNENPLVPQTAPSTSLKIPQPNEGALSVNAQKERDREVDKIRRKASNRRRRRMFGMLRRFVMYVVFPTFIFGYYQFEVSTPLYQTEATLSVEKAQSAAGAGSSSFFDSLGLNNDENIGIQNYLESRDIFLQLENDFDFPALFMSEDMDFMKKVDADINEAERYKIFKKYAKSNFDTTDQVLRLDIRTPDRESGETVANLMIKYAEENLDKKTIAVREGELSSARSALAEAQKALDEAEENLIGLKSDPNNNINAAADIERINTEIATLETERNTLYRELSLLENNASPNQIRVEDKKREIKGLEEAISRLNDEAQLPQPNGKSLLVLAQEIIFAESQVASATVLLEQQNQLYLGALAKVQEQNSYLTTNVPPISSFDPVFPRSLLSTITAFGVFFAIYLFAAMTIDVIREQIAAS